MPDAAPPKPIYQSKIFWANLVGIAALAASMAGVDVGLGTPEQQAEAVAGILAFVNIVLRFITRQPIGNPS